MQLSPGSSLGNYSISALLGSGGMGEVYRATDKQLGREVAIKVLPEEFTRDGERLARFEREARVLASLNHPSVASIYGFEQANGTRFLVMELAEGRTLADELASRGAIPVGESLALARQIADALDAAHEKGIVHRDLKPANIVVDDEGRVKVLDFGLARAVEPEHSDPDVSKSPTMAHATRAGIILGTAGYMSPEQARGRRVDRRADIWSFGVVLWEMLAGRRLFEGETVSDTVASVLTKTIDLTALPPSTPRGVVWLLERCLERDPKKRLRDIGDARLLLDRGDAAAESAGTAVRHRRFTPERIVWVSALALCIVAAIVLWMRRGSPETERVLRAAVPLPAGTRLALSGVQPGPPAVSPDGKRIALVLDEPGGVRRLWVRGTDEARPHVVEGTENASYPFWSPDSQEIAFFADDKLKRVPASGGAVLTITSAPNPKGGSWNRDGVIIFCPKFDAPLMRVKASGGTAEPLTTLDLAAGDASHRFPQFLADGKRFLYTVRKRSDATNVTMLGSLDRSVRPRVVVESCCNALVAAGHLLYLRDGNLMAQPFDEKTGMVTGAAIAVAENIKKLTAAAVNITSASDDLLLFQTGVAVTRLQLTWVDRAGVKIADLGEPDDIGDYVMSPDGTRIATESLDPLTGTSDIWIVDAKSGNRQRVTFDPANEMSPVWSPDGERIVYRTNARGPWELVVEDVGRRGASKTLLTAANRENPTPVSWSPDGNSLLYDVEKIGSNGTTIMLLDLRSGRSSALTDVAVRGPRPQFSPDGKWVSFLNLNTAGVPAIFVVRFPDFSRRWQVAIGDSAFWRRDGRELFFTNLQSQVWGVPVEARDDAFGWGSAVKLFTAEVRLTREGTPFSSEGNRFLVARSSDAKEASEPLEMIVNWKRLVEK